jgi:hypothetical protein
MIPALPTGRSRTGDVTSPHLVQGPSARFALAPSVGSDDTRRVIIRDVLFTYSELYLVFIELICLFVYLFISQVKMLIAHVLSPCSDVTTRISLYKPFVVISLF